VSRLAHGKAVEGGARFRRSDGRQSYPREPTLAALAGHLKFAVAPPPDQPPPELLNSSGRISTGSMSAR